MVQAIILLIAAMMCCVRMHITSTLHRNDSNDYKKKIPFVLNINDSNSQMINNKAMINDH